MSVQLPREAVERAVRDIQMGAVTMGSGTSKGGTSSRAKRLRDRHHLIARLVAADIQPQIICKRMGLTWARLEMLRDHTPAFQQLVVEYRTRKEEIAPEDVVDLLERNMIAAELEIADRLAEEPEKFSISELHKVSRDAADRLGYSKHSVNLNVNVTLKDRLEGLRRRARGAPAGAGDGGGAGRVVPDSAAPPLLELKANPVQASPIAHGPKPEGPVAAIHHSPLPPASDPTAPMTRDEVLARHRAGLESVTAWARNRPAPLKEPIKRRI